MKRQLTFEIVKTGAEAKALLEQQPRHLRQGYTPWQASDGSYDGYIVWYKR